MVPRAGKQLDGERQYAPRMSILGIATETYRSSSRYLGITDAAEKQQSK
jgi:hypothetical protein